MKHHFEMQIKPGTKKKKQGLQSPKINIDCIGENEKNNASQIQTPESSF